MFLHCSLLSPSSLIIFVLSLSIHIRCAKRNSFFDTMLLRLVEDQSLVVMYISCGFTVTLLPFLHPSLPNFVKMVSINNHIANDHHSHPIEIFNLVCVK